MSLTEKLLGRRWDQITSAHGEWGRDGLLAVATRHLGWRLGEVVGKNPSQSYGAAAQGIRQFWKQLSDDWKGRPFEAL
ncbi:MAG: hypothetical protein U1G08_05520 [Verrucomicrobiota bacterium]